MSDSTKGTGSALAVARPVRSSVLRTILAILLLLLLLPSGAGPRAKPSKSHAASGFLAYKYPAPQPACDGVGLLSTNFSRGDCGFGIFSLSNSDADTKVTVQLTGAGASEPFLTEEASFDSTDESWDYPIVPDENWPAGEIGVAVFVAGESVPAGITSFMHNALVAIVEATPKADGSAYRPGEAITVSGTVSQINDVATAPMETGVPATFSLQLVTPLGDVRGPFGPFTAGSDGSFSESIPGTATADLSAGADSGFETIVSVEVVDVSYEDSSTGAWASERAGAAPVTLRVVPTGLVLENSFVSSLGWVKPGESYPFRLIVKNFSDKAHGGAVVRVPATDGTTFTEVSTKAGTAAIGEDGSITWTVGNLPAGKDGAATVRTLVAQARADTLGQDPRIAWKDLSTTATLTAPGASALSVESHGPKVIPPFETFETARYGDRPFPVVPVDFFDRSHDGAHSGKKLADVINSPLVKGSTFNLYQEMSYGQLFPNGTVPSAQVATAGWDAEFSSRHYRENGFVFSDLEPQGTCKGTTLKQLAGTPLYGERIRDGWYQLPGTTEYYGGDQFGSGIVGAQIGNSTLTGIDSACGPTSKAVYDAAMIADPEIDYSDYDTDKDGVVDFFMMVFVGLGGNGASQGLTLDPGAVPPYDNIWPHSSTLEDSWVDAETGLRGYVSDDQLRDLEDRPLYYTDKERTTMTTDVTKYPVHVRVGPYNVNPESAIDKASVISHEYGHSLGLPDFYRNGGLQTYGKWNLMASDYSQHMDVFSKQELGWIVPRVLPKGETILRDWRDSKHNTHRIDWVTPDGQPYTLLGPGVNNGEAYVAKLPAKRVIDPKVVEAGASAPHVWWSRSGNDFGCPPLKGHNLDIALPELAKVPAGTEVIATFKSFWEIEWDFDYGFTMLSTNGGESYQALPSMNNFTTPAAINPNANACQTQFGNGLTGSSGSYATPGGLAVDRAQGIYQDPVFVEDSYDLSSAAGKSSVLRFSYATDPGLAMKGWFIDDLTITAGGKVIYQTDFEEPVDTHVFNGACRDDLRVGPKCTDGWSYLQADADSTADHAYYMEMRDRSGFEFKDGHGQSDRGDITWAPGLLLVYTDENHGYGNNGVSGAPAQSPVDSQPQPGAGAPTDGLLEDFPNLDDAAFTAAAGDSKFSDFGKGYVDNYEDPTSADGLWHHAYDCLSVEVLGMDGNDIGPEEGPGNLVGDVKINTGGGCGTFDRGFGVPNLPPIPIIQLKPKLPRPGEPARFDAGASYDDKDASNRLRYSWDFEGDGRFDASGASVEHTFARAGQYKVVLKATDSSGAAATTTQTITISGVLGDAQLPATGVTSWPGLLGIVALVLSMLTRRSLRSSSS